MLNGARSAPRAAGRADHRSPTWGPVDAILALVLLPFGVWFLLIDRMVATIAWIIDRGPPVRRR